MFDRLRLHRGNTVTTQTTAVDAHKKPSSGDIESQTPIPVWKDPYGPGPGIKGWFRLFWHDVVAFILLAALALWLLMWSPVPYNKYFLVSPIYSSAADYAHPKRKQYVPIIADALVAVFAPIVCILLLNFRRHGGLLRSFWNVNNGCLGVIYSVMTGATLQIIIKLVIPGQRPHFLSVCDPQVPADSDSLYHTVTVCRDYKSRESEIANALQSFPSGHSVAAWAGLFYLSLYLNGHLKVFATYHTAYWKLLVFVAPMLGATLMVGSLALDMSHNWYDIVAGSAIGVAMAVMSYRMCFASVWDFRWNHVPLCRGKEGLQYSAQEMGAWVGGCPAAKGEWGMHNGARKWGAPGDSSTFFAAGGGGGGLERYEMGAMNGNGHGYHRGPGNGVTEACHGTRNGTIEAQENRRERVI